MSDEMTHTVPCPSCKKDIVIRLKEMIDGKTKKCPHCNDGLVEFKGSGGAQVQKAMDDLKKSLRDLGYIDE